MSNLNKQAIINLENTAHYQPRSDLNIAFSTADRDSAVFKFNVTKNNKPLLLSEQNVLGHIAFSHSDKSFVKTTLDFSEHNINGQFEVHVPNDLLKRQGTVTMQVYVSEKGNSNVVVAERILTFKIEQSIVSEISAETSLQYIIEFDELLQQVNQRMIAINDSMANAEDYVSLINQAKEQGLSDIEIARSTSIQEINTLVANKLQELETKGNQYSTKFDNDKAEMDSKKEEFDLAVQGSGLVTTGQSSNWQKHKLTNDNGNSNFISDLDMENIEGKITKAGSYWVSGIKNGPLNINGVLLAIHGASDSYKKFVYTPHNSNRIFIKSKNGSVWTEWEEVGADPNKVETLIGSQAKANIAESNAKTYAKDLVDKKTNVLFEGTANGVGTSINLNETLDNFIVVFVYGNTPGGDFVETADPQGTNDFVFEKTNVIGDDGSQATVFECLIQKVSRTNLKIIGDTYHGISSSTGSGPNANRFTINKIVGVRK
ncbi:BppU family phage baseplate upper protein [Mammaliicoccus sciuri]|uniref:BppU family phage baseplate upper protein n=1 Tax=Mammaliicoccus sciuri TaxID=1296 RepID=UPI002737B35D|nr:BppU family phage baseplate upper protein [Mammaliicoccus sciuri]